MEIYGHVSRFECEELMHWASLGGPKTALEVGHYKGRSTAAILCGLPPFSSLVTIDHHGGDSCVAASDPTEFREAIRPFVAAGALGSVFAVYEPFEVAIPKIQGWFDFVYYDATHTPEACEAFWSAVSSKLAPRCRVLWDDADWPQMARLGELALANGFRDVTRFPFARGAKESADSDAYTMAVVER